jgi:hypothetical protein
MVMSYIPRYKDTKNKVVKICLSCNHVEELTEATIECPTCGLVGSMGFWNTEYKFQRYIRMYQPKDLNIVGDNLKTVYKLNIS